MNYKFFSVLIVLATLTTGCAANVHYFTHPVSQKQADKAATVKLYIDSRGNLYPDSEEIIFPPREKVKGDLYTLAARSSLCNLVGNDSEWSELCQAAQSDTGCRKNISLCLPYNEAWLQAQTSLWEKAAEKIYREASKGPSKGPSKGLFFLIHGFNNREEKSSKVFQLVKNAVSEELGNSPHPLFVEVYWDGFAGLPLLTKSWGKAEYSGPLVGFNLRQLFKGIKTSYQNKELPTVYMFSHSSGAFVIASLLGNPYAAQPALHGVRGKNLAYKLFRDYRDGKNPDYPIPNMAKPYFPEIRVGMIAAATPTGTFHDHAGIDETRDAGWLAQKTHITFSISSDDAVLSKVFGFQNISVTGATGSGSDEVLHCKFLGTLKNMKAEDTVALRFNQNQPFPSIFDSHGVEHYFKHKNKTPFIQYLLGRTPSDAPDICPLEYTPAHSTG